MSDPVDVQAERLRELAEASRRFGQDAERGSREWSRLPWQDHLADFVVSDEDAAFIAACDPQTVLALLDLLAGQAEQIERLERQNGELDFRLVAEKSVHRMDNRELVRQRNNLRDALQRIGTEATDDAGWMRATALRALRAAAVGGDNSAYGEQVWERC